MARKKKYNKLIEFEPIDTNVEIWSKRIAERLNELGMTQEELAKKSGVSKATITAWLFGDRKRHIRTEPRINNLNSVAKVLGVSVDYLIGNTNIKPLDLTLQDIEKHTGLSQNAVEVLIHFDDDKRDILSKVIESGEFHDIIRLIAFAQIDKDILYPSGDYTAAIVVKKLNDFRNGAKKSHLEKIMERISQQVVGRGLEPFYKQLIIEDITTIFEKITGGEQ